MPELLLYLFVAAAACLAGAWIGSNISTRRGRETPRRSSAEWWPYSWYPKRLLALQRRHQSLDGPRIPGVGWHFLTVDLPEWEAVGCETRTSGPL